MLKKQLKHNNSNLRFLSLGLLAFLAVVFIYACPKAPAPNNDDEGEDNISGNLDTALPTPEAPTATGQDASNPYSLSWSAVDVPEDIEIAYYQIARKLAGGSYEILDITSDLSLDISKYTITTDTYSYSVRVCSDNACNSYGEYSAAVEVSPATIQGLTLKSTTLSWDAVKSATSYEVQKKIGGTYTDVDISTSPVNNRISASVEDSENKYRVRACRGDSCTAYSGDVENTAETTLNLKFEKSKNSHLSGSNDVVAVFEGNNATIYPTVDAEHSTPKKFIPSIEVSSNVASVEVGGSALDLNNLGLQDYSDPVTYELTTKDGKTASYTVRLVLGGRFLSFEFSSSDNPNIVSDEDGDGNRNAEAEFEGYTGTIKLVAKDSMKFVPTFTVAPNTQVTINGNTQTSGGTVRSFDNSNRALDFIVQTGDGPEQKYEIKVDFVPKFLSFEFKKSKNANIFNDEDDDNDDDVEASFSGTTGILKLSADSTKSNPRTFTPSYTLSAGTSTVSVGGTPQTSGEISQDFTDQKTYALTSGDKSIAYTMKISLSGRLQSFRFDTAYNPISSSVNASLSQDPIKPTVNINSLGSKLKTSFVVTEGATAYIGGILQTSNVTRNNFISRKTYQVKGENYDAQTYTVEPTINHVGLTNVGNVADSTTYTLDGLQSLALAKFSDSNQYLLASGAIDRGMTSFKINKDGSLTYKDRELCSNPDSINCHLRGIQQLTTRVHGTRATVIQGSVASSISQYYLSATGSFTLKNSWFGRDDDDYDFSAPGYATWIPLTNGDVYWYVAGNEAINIFYQSDQSGSDSMRFIGGVIDNTAVNVLLDGIHGIHSRTFDNVDYLYAAIQGGAISVYKRRSGSINLVQIVATAGSSNYQLAGASDLTSVKVGYKYFLFVVGKDDDGLTVFEINQTNGELTYADHKTDDATLELKGAVDVAHAEIDGIHYIFVTGYWDHGFSVFSVANDGKLTHVTSITDNSTYKLNRAQAVLTTEIATGITGSTYIYVGGYSDGGISIFY